MRRLAAPAFVTAALTLGPFAPTPAAADFSGFYGGLNGGYAKDVDDPDPRRPQSLRSSPPSPRSTGTVGTPETSSPLLRREDLPASMRGTPRSLDGR
jgi:hypothetical protein